MLEYFWNTFSLAKVVGCLKNCWKSLAAGRLVENEPLIPIKKWPCHPMSRRLVLIFQSHLSDQGPLFALLSWLIAWATCTPKISSEWIGAIVICVDVTLMLGSGLNASFYVFNVLDTVACNELLQNYRVNQFKCQNLKAAETTGFKPGTFWLSCSIRPRPWWCILTFVLMSDWGRCMILLAMFVHAAFGLWSPS